MVRVMLDCDVTLAYVPTVENKYPRGKKNRWKPGGSVALAANCVGCTLAIN